MRVFSQTQILISLLYFSMFYPFLAISSERIQKDTDQSYLIANSCNEVKTSINKIENVLTKFKLEPAFFPSQAECTKDHKNKYKINISSIQSSEVLGLNAGESNYNGPNCFNSILHLLGVNKHNRFVSGEEINFWLNNSELCSEVMEPIPGDITLFIENNKPVHAQVYITENITLSKDSFVSFDKMKFRNTSSEINDYSHAKRKYFRCNHNSKLKKINSDNIDQISCQFMNTLYLNENNNNNELFHLLGNSIQILKNSAIHKLKNSPNDKQAIYEISAAHSLETQLNFYLTEYYEPLAKKSTFSKVTSRPLNAQEALRIENFTNWNNWTHLSIENKHRVLNDIFKTLQQFRELIPTSTLNSKLSKFIQSVDKNDNELLLNFLNSMSIKEKRFLYASPKWSISENGEKVRTIPSTLFQSLENYIEIDPRLDFKLSLHEVLSNESFERNYSLKEIAQDILKRDGELLKKEILGLSELQQRKLESSKVINQILRHINNPTEHKPFFKDPNYPFVGGERLNKYMKKKILTLISN